MLIMLSISIDRAKDKKITNECARKWFNDAETFDNACRKRQLLFLGRLVRLGRDKHLLLMIVDAL